MNEKNIKLVIAEKPSVAQSIAKVIGADKREDGYLEGNGYVVSWCVGHLVELASPESYDEKYEKWRYEDLPILPSEWNYQIAEATRKQFGILKKLMEREDVTGLVEATDAGREGELIFRLVYDQAKCKKPFERLWISSMEDQAISDGFSNLKNGREYDDLYRAALCRERADWIVGMNATRLFSTLYGQTLNVRRVMTPTLAMIVQREAEIDGFKPESIYRLSISCGGITALSDRFEKKQDAENILNMLKEQKSAQVTKINPADKQEKAPQLYSLTALQRDANRFLGFTAQQTLDYTQSLYEKKLVTYPRTDSRFLTEDMESMIPDLAGKMAAKFGYTRKMVVHPKQVINNSKVSDHHAIIPTVNVADAEFGELPSGEQKVLSLITARLLSALGDPAVRNEVDVEFTCADTVFRAKAKNIREKSYSFKEAANILGIHDCDLYDIWKNEKLEYITVDFVRRIPIDIFEKWYANQDIYRKVTHIPTAEELEKDYICLQDAADLLGISREKLAKIARSEEIGRLLDSTICNNKRWITRKSFQLFLNAQNVYHITDDEDKKKESRGLQEKETLSLMVKEYISRQDAAELAGVNVSTVTKWMQSGEFQCIGAGKVLRVHRQQFLKWLEKNREGVM